MLLLYAGRPVHDQLCDHANRTGDRSGTFWDHRSQCKRRWALGADEISGTWLIWVYYPEHSGWFDSVGNTSEGYIPEGHAERTSLEPGQKNYFRR